MDIGFTMSGSASGGLKLRARAAGVTVDELLAMQRVGLKWCRSCDNWLSLAVFGLDHSRVDGRKYDCSECLRVGEGPSKPERRAKAETGLYWCRSCEDWRPSTRSGPCREHASATYREQYARSPEAIKARNRARKRSLNEPIPTWFMEAERELLGGLCAYGCGRKATTDDHIIPVSKDGLNLPWNLVPACPTCNSSKGNRDPRPWIKRGLASDYAGDYWHEKLALKGMMTHE